MTTQTIVRLVVKDVLVGDDTITIRHSISLPTCPPQNNAPPPIQPDAQSYLLRKGSDHRPLRGPDVARRPLCTVHHSSLQPLANQANQARIADPMFNETDEPLVTHRIEK